MDPSHRPNYYPEQWLTSPSRELTTDPLPCHSLVRAWKRLDCDGALQRAHCTRRTSPPPIHTPARCEEPLLETHQSAEAEEEESRRQEQPGLTVGGSNMTTPLAGTSQLPTLPLLSHGVSWVEGNCNPPIRGPVMERTWSLRLRDGGSSIGPGAPDLSWEVIDYFLHMFLPRKRDGQDDHKTTPTHRRQTA